MVILKFVELFDRLPGLVGADVDELGLLHHILPPTVKEVRFFFSTTT